MKKATMFVVGALMIVMLVSMSVPAETSTDYDEFRDAPKHRGPFQEVEKENNGNVRPLFDTDLLYVDSNGGAITCCESEDAPSLNGAPGPHY